MGLTGRLGAGLRKLLRRLLRPLRPPLSLRLLLRLHQGKKEAQAGGKG